MRDDPERRANAGLSTRAPTRIDFGGGWSDVPPYCDREGGYVCNLAIARYSAVRVHASDDDDVHVTSARDGDCRLAEAALHRAGVHGVALRLTNDFPVGAGLGGSSAAGVALQAALALRDGHDLTRAALAEASRAVEVDEMGIAGGRQDHYAAAFGGALGLRFVRDADVDVERISLPGSLAASLERRCILVYTGESRISGDTITAVLDGYLSGERRVVDALSRMKGLAMEMRDALTAGDVDALGALVGEHWTHQRSLHAKIPTARIDAIIAAAARAGAIGAKALGASGGGCVLLVARDDAADTVAAAVEGMGVRLPFTIDHQGVTATD